MSDAVSATGILVKRSPFPVASPGVYTTVSELVTVTPPKKSRNKIETSTHNDGSESYILGIIRQGDGAYRINYIFADPTHTVVSADFDGNVKASWKFLFPSGLDLTGPGRVMAFGMVDVPVDAAQQADISIAWAGPIVITG